MMAKIYLAARFGRRPDCFRIAEELKLLGHEISCRWVTRHQDHVMPEGLSPQAADTERERFAREDIEDVEAADWCISLMDQPRSNGRGGRHVEFGYCLKKGMRMTIIGVRETVFHHLPQVEQFDDEEAFWSSIYE